MFYDNFVKLCNAAGKTPSAIATEIGLSKSVVTRWKNGCGATDATIRKLADYFGVSTDQLLGTTDDPTPAAEQKKEPATESLDLDDELNAEFIKLWKKLTPEERVILRAQMRGMLNDRES